MTAKRGLTMRQLRYLLRFHHDGVSTQEIGRKMAVARGTIQDNLKRAAGRACNGLCLKKLRTMCLNSGCLAAAISTPRFDLSTPRTHEGDSKGTDFSSKITKQAQRLKVPY